MRRVLTVEEVLGYWQVDITCPLCGEQAKIGVDLRLSEAPGQSHPVLDAEFFVVRAEHCPYEYAGASFSSFDPSEWDGTAPTVEVVAAEVVDHCVEQAENPNWEMACEFMGVEPWELFGDSEGVAS